LSGLWDTHFFEFTGTQRRGDRNRGGTAMGAGDQPETKNSKVGH